MFDRLRLLFKARRVSAYTTKQGTFVPEHLDKREPAKADNQLGLFSALDTPPAERATVRQEAELKREELRQLAPETAAADEAVLSGGPPNHLLALSDRDLGGIYRDYVAMNDYRISAYPSDETLNKYADWARRSLQGEQVGPSDPADFARFARLRREGTRLGMSLNQVYQAFRNGKDAGDANGPDPILTPLFKETKDPRGKTAHKQTGAGLDYSGDWSSIEAQLPAFGAQPGWSANRRKKANEDALEVLAQRGDLTEKDRKKLALYSGNGGIGDSLNEYYTPPAVAAAMWKILITLGLSKGHVLEPCAGSGVFLETKPTGIQMTATEWDATAARINAKLHPDDAVLNLALEQHVTADPTKYDAVIGNVPFGVRGAIAAHDKPDLATAEEYFVDTALDKTKDGGVVCLIVPHGIATNPSSRSFRQRVMQKADVLGIHRMPNTAFKHSGTGVITDVLVLRKRPQEVAGALTLVDDPEDLKALGVYDRAWVDGKILEVSGRGYLHGTAQANWRGGLDVTGDMDGVPAAIALSPFDQTSHVPKTFSDIATHFEDKPDFLKRLNGASRKNPYPELPDGTTKLVNGVLYVLQGDPRRWHRADELGEMQYAPDSKEGRALELGQRLKYLADAASQGHQVSDRLLKEEVLAFTKEFGIPMKDKTLVALAERDPRFYPLIAALNEEGKPSDLLEGKLFTIDKKDLDRKDFDAVVRRMLEGDGRSVTVEQIEAAWEGATEAVADARQDILQRLMSSDRYAVSVDGKQWILREDFTSGDLYPKRDAFAAAIEATPDGPITRKLQEQLGWLDEAIQPKTLEEFEVSLRAGWIPTNVLARYFDDVAKQFGSSGVPPKYSVTFEGGVYVIQNHGGDAYLDGPYNDYLNRLKMTEKEWKRIPELEEDFKNWLATSPFRAEIEDKYNRLYNSFRPKRYGNKPVELPGWNPDRTLNAYQHPALRWAAEEGKGIISYDVGIGKTPFSIALVKMLKNEGKTKRPIIVVPKSLTANWVSEIQAFAPGSKVLVIGETHTRGKDGKLKATADDPKERHKKWHQMTQENFDYVLVTQPAFNEITLDPIKRGEYVESDFWVQRADKLEEGTRREIREIREQYQQAMANKDFRARTNVIYWNDLGVDCVIADEGHNFKNLYEARSRFGGKPKFLGGSGFAKRALDMEHKCRFVRENNNGRGVYFLTATPTKNSPLEVYSMLAHIAPEAFTQRGIRHAEDFIDRYCETAIKPVLDTNGEITMSSVVTGFKNMNELRAIMGRYIYRKTAEDVGLKIPAKDTIEHYIDMTQDQQHVYAAIREMAKDAKSKDTGEAHVFTLMDKMGKASMDLTLLDGKWIKGVKSFDSPKYDAVATEVKERLKDGGQIIFADQIAIHQKSKDKLIAAGVPENHIGIINADVAKDSAKRHSVADDYVQGKLRVVIGNTATMGEGVNLQTLTSDIHHMDLPWEPSSMQQRNGRGIRQGNKLEAVRVHTYLAKKSFDGYRYQTIAGKKEWMDQLWRGGDRIENLAAEQGTLSHDDFLIMMADDPDAARAELTKNKDAQLEKYRAVKKAEAYSQFTHLQKLRRTYDALLNKETKTAQLLKIRMERVKNDLHKDEHFENKHLLSIEKPMMLSPTGVPFYEGATIKMSGGDDAPLRAKSKGDSKWRVMGLDIPKASVTLREIGAVPSRYDYNWKPEVTVRVEDLKSGIEPAEEVTLGDELKHMIPKVRKPEHLRIFPSALIESHADQIQHSLRDRMKTKPDYSGDIGEHMESMWALNEGGRPTKMFPGEAGADKATYVLPIKPHIEPLVKLAWNEKTQSHYGSSSYNTVRGTRQYGSTYYQDALREVIGWEAMHQLFEKMQDYKTMNKEPMEAVDTVLKSRLPMAFRRCSHG
jgi:SNF2 family DNA or RNA helicase/predicted RNA methylase